MRTVVLLHGFWHGSWCWSEVTAELAARGVPSVALDGQGQGLRGRSPASRWARPFQADIFAQEPSPVATVTATTAAADLLQQIRRVGNGQSCVLVAHSAYGAVATLAAEIDPGAVSHLVYVAAFAPTQGASIASYMSVPENSGEMGSALLRGNPFVLGASRLDTANTAHHADIKEALYGDVDDDTAMAAISLLNTDAPVGVATEEIAVTRGRYGRIPKTYVVCTQDRNVRPELQRRLVREIDAVSHERTTVVEMNSSHSPFLSQPDVLAGIVESAWRSVDASRPDTGDQEFLRSRQGQVDPTRSTVRVPGSDPRLA